MASIFKKAVAAAKSLLSSTAGKAVKTFVQNEFEQALAAAKTTTIGAAMTNAINAAEATGKSGSAKRADVIAAVSPLIVSLATKQGRDVLMSDVETFAGNLLESMLADIKSTGPLLVAQVVLASL